MRAEANPEAESAAEEAPEAEVEAAVESDAQPEEEKPSRKPRVKLGDVMGVIILSFLRTKEHIFFSFEAFLQPEM